MKPAFTSRHFLFLLASALTTCGVFSRAAAEENPGSFEEKMEKSQSAMTDSYSATLKNWHGRKGGRSFGAASVDLREQRGRYVVRVSLPDRDVNNTKIALRGNALQIVAPTEKSGEQYEQSITLPHVNPGARLDIERRPKDHLLVINVSKGSTAAKPALDSPAPDPSLLPLADWDRDILARMEKSQHDMDRIFDKAFDEFRMIPERKGYVDQARFGSSLDLEDEGKNYVVRAYLPDRNIKDVDVKIIGSTLSIEARAEEGSKPGKSGTDVRKAQYLQMITLPGPVASQKMDTQRRNQMLIITVPKA